MNNWETVSLEQYRQATTDKDIPWTRRAQIINAFRRRLKKYPLLVRRGILRGEQP